ncbi:MAG: alpha-ketoglutarate-dependent taurine dioxygenase [Candidatus Entotheonella factor]|uniref:Alpha-ketoglutarate-dependent taurine dioxygenase n=2 Tax=Candidatus Entotheonella TaxID=93171 RepID=W4LB86_ENTF1|nr:MAG: alpha-ketoglutarate-dependent taurine dioxygenase [Candidatus Entotheonella factor]
MTEPSATPDRDEWSIIMSYQTIEVQPISGALGAEIHGVDIASGISGEQFAEMRQAFGEYGVIFFRDQVLSPEQHIGFAERWGEININRFFTPVDGYPMIAEVRKEPHHGKNVGGGWHTDHSYDTVPAMGSILYAHEVPESGGDTMFASMYLAYEALSDGLKQTLEGLRAVHSSRHVFGKALDERYHNPELATQDAVHPVVIRHPDTGRKALYVNAGFTLRFEGWTEEESKPLLSYLYQHAARPEFTCRFRWQKGSIAFWDNRSTWHYALNDYPGQRRLMHRITVEGVPLG